MILFSILGQSSLRMVTIIMETRPCTQEFSETRWRSTSSSVLFTIKDCVTWSLTRVRQEPLALMMPLLINQWRVVRSMEVSVSVKWREILCWPTVLLSALMIVWWNAPIIVRATSAKNVEVFFLAILIGRYWRLKVKYLKLSVLTSRSSASTRRFTAEFVTITIAER